MDQYYWRNTQKVEIKRIPGSFGVGLANQDLVLRASNYFTNQNYIVLPTVKKRLIIAGADCKPEQLRRDWPYEEIKYITYSYQDNEDVIFPTDELRIESAELSESELERLSKLKQIAKVLKKECCYECKLNCPDGDAGLQTYQKIYEGLNLPVTINFLRQRLKPQG